jgi:hypothetical protein
MNHKDEMATIPRVAVLNDGAISQLVLRPFRRRLVGCSSSLQLETAGL